MTRLFKILLIVFAVALITPNTIGPAYAASDDDEDLDQSTKDRKLKEKEQKKKDKKFNDNRLYRFMVGPNVLSVGPFTISLYVRGQLVEGKLRIAILAKDTQAKSALEGEKWTINGIVYPLALRMWENGRPTTEDILNFKSDIKSQLQRRYTEQIEDVFIESIM
jgi:flagellar basal body-associated protein FliL